jgi:transposase
MTRKPYPSDISDEEWSFIAPYLSLMTEDAPQREHNLREVFNALRWIVRTGAPWRLIPNDFPRCEAVYQQTQRWIKAEVFMTIAQDLRMILRALGEREPQPTAAIFDSRTLRCTPVCAALLKVVTVVVMTVTSARKAAKFTLP